ncbi:endonuclease domain-containing protein [Luteimonas sp. SX5]|uniref:Endonuclease domain-containing protein n=2 Tax=Luteimonas galliterrae TaxID=2940486 RepID=A0ABT0MJM8_9GAMM|nr:endonuclease domain-containing protein [Luteimonas galliterrae]
MTDAERRFWYCVRRKRFSAVQFYRQTPIGRYIVDFYAPAAGLVVEIDGGQHFTEGGRAADALRDAALMRMGLRVLRFDDRMVLMETDAVLDVVWNAVCAAIGAST